MNTVNSSMQNVQATQKHQVSKIAYLLFIFFLGGFGAHKFYAGKVGIGFLYLIFFWTTIPAFIALIEFIITCFKPSDALGRIVV